MVEQFQVNSSNINEVKEAAAAHAPSNTPTPLNPTAKVTGETSRVVFKDGKATATHLSQSNVRSSDAAPMDSLGDLAGKPVVARNDLGRQLTGSEIKPDSFVKLGEMTTTVSAARAIGLVVERDGNLYFAGDAKQNFESAVDSATQGNNNEPAANHSEQQQQDQHQQDAPVIEPLDPESEAAMTEVLTTLPEPEVNAFAREMVETGSLSPEAVAKVAQRFGIDEQAAAQKAQGLHAAFRAQADRVVGPHADEVWEYARRIDPQGLKAAVMEQINQGTTNGYREFASRFIEDLAAFYPHHLLNDNAARAMNVRRESDGAITIDVPGIGRMAWRTAVKGGFVKVNVKSNPFIGKQ